MIEKGSMFKAWEATTEQQKKAHEMQAIYKAQETARQAIQEAMNRYIKKKTRARSVAKAEADPFAELEGWESLDQIQEAYGYGEITSDRRDKLTDLWEARETAQRKGKKDGKYHDLVTDMLARAIHSVGIEYADEIAAYEEERRMRRSYYEKVENRANGLQEEEPEEPDPLSPARAAAQRYAADNLKARKLCRLAQNRHQGRNHNKAGGIQPLFLPAHILPGRAGCGVAVMFAVSAHVHAWVLLRYNELFCCSLVCDPFEKRKFF